MASSWEVFAWEQNMQICKQRQRCSPSAICMSRSRLPLVGNKISISFTSATNCFTSGSPSFTDYVLEKVCNCDRVWVFVCEREKALWPESSSSGLSVINTSRPLLSGLRAAEGRRLCLWKWGMRLRRRPWKRSFLLLLLLSGASRQRDKDWRDVTQQVRPCVAATPAYVRSSGHMKNYRVYNW